MLNKIGWFLCFILSIFLLNDSSAHAIWGGKITSFTADQVHISADGKIVANMKIYITPDKMRIDGMPGCKEDLDISMIYLKGEKIHYMINHTRKLFIKMPLDEEKMKQAIKSVETSENKKILGTEKVNGFKCIKKEIETTVKLMGFKQKTKTIVWVAKSLDMPIRTKMDDGAITELRNLKKGIPEDRYFQVPKGYKQAPNMMALIGMDLEDSLTEEKADDNIEKKEKKREPFKLPEGLKKFNPFGKE